MTALGQGFVNEQKQTLPSPTGLAVRVRIRVKMTSLVGLIRKADEAMSACDGSSDPAGGVREGFPEEVMLEQE